MTTITVTTAGAASDAVRARLRQLVDERFASRLFAGDATLWGEAAEAEASKRLGWTSAMDVSRPLLADIAKARDELRADGVTRIVLCGMGGSSLAPEVITRTQDVPLTVLDSTDPAQVRAVVDDELQTTAVVVSSKSGSTVETDSQRRTFVAAFEQAGIDPAGRIIIVTDPGSPMEEAARAAGHRVFLADPTVGGRYSALTAFGLVPSGLAGADLERLLDEAAAVRDALARDHAENPGLVLGAALAGGTPLKTFLGVVDDGSGLVGMADWIEQLIAESTGKDGTGILPIAMTDDAPEVGSPIPDLQVARLVADAAETPALGDELNVSGPLGAQMLLWEVATAAAGRVLGIDPFDQPDVESAKVAARALLETMPEPEQPAFEERAIRARGTASVVEGRDSIAAAVDALLAQLPEGGYVGIHAYVDRLALGPLAELRDIIAERCRRPVAFGWGPRFLHSTGQFMKGGPQRGVFLQLTSDDGIDLEIPERPFTFGRLIRAQADGDRTVLEEHGRPVLQLELTEPSTAVATLRDLLSEVS